MYVVQCCDGFYHRPMWYGKLENGKSWLVEVNDCLRLYVEVDKREQASVSLARKVLSDWPIVFSGKREFNDIGIFPPEWERHLCYMHILRMKGVLPAPNESKGKFDEPPLDNLLFCWKVEFRTEEVWWFFQTKPHHLKGTLSDFMLEKAITSPFAEQKIVQSRLRRQFPDMRKLTLEQAVQKYGERTLVRKG